VVLEDGPAHVMPQLETDASMFGVSAFALFAEIRPEFVR